MAGEVSTFFPMKMEKKVFLKLGYFSSPYVLRIGKIILKYPKGSL